jgi:hypothetical protein
LEVVWLFPLEVDFFEAPQDDIITSPEDKE